LARIVFWTCTWIAADWMFNYKVAKILKNITWETCTIHYFSIFRSINIFCTLQRHPIVVLIYLSTHVFEIFFLHKINLSLIQKNEMLTSSKYKNKESRNWWCPSVERQNKTIKIFSIFSPKLQYEEKYQRIFWNYRIGEKQININFTLLIND